MLNCCRSPLVKISHHNTLHNSNNVNLKQEYFKNKICKICLSLPLPDINQYFPICDDDL